MQDTPATDAAKILSFVNTLSRKIKSEQDHMTEKYNFNFEEDIPINTNNRTFNWQSKQLEFRMDKTAPRTPVIQKQTV